MISDKPYVVPAKDDKDQDRYFLVRLSTPDQVNEKVKRWVHAHPGWKVTGEAVEAIENL